MIQPNKGGPRSSVYLAEKVLGWNKNWFLWDRDDYRCFYIMAYCLALFVLLVAVFCVCLMFLRRCRVNISFILCGGNLVMTSKHAANCGVYSGH